MTPSTPWHPPPGLTLCNPPFMTEPTPLSPAAQAVLDAWAASENGVYLEGDPERLAAALRASADQVVPPPEGDGLYDCCAGIVEQVRSDLLAIAAELEGAG